jgi:hypothetical protein
MQRTNRKAQNLMPLASGDSVIMFSDGSLVMDLGALIELGRGHRTTRNSKQPSSGQGRSSAEESIGVSNGS